MNTSLTAKQANSLITELEKMNKGAIGELRQAFEVLRVDIEALCAEVYLLIEWDVHHGESDLCNEERARVAVETLGDIFNGFPHYLEKFRRAVINYAEAEGWPLPHTLKMVGRISPDA